MPASWEQAFGGLLLILVVLVPTGLALLRLLELAVGHKFVLSPVERCLAAFYASGFLFYVLASLALGIYGSTLVVIVLTAGTALYAYFVIRDRSAWTRQALGLFRTPEFLLLAAGFLGLLVFEVFPIWNHPFSNAWDGGATALWTQLILSHGGIPNSLQPFSGAPIVYPMGTSVWMGLAVLILGWPIVQMPVLLPALFLSLTVPAAFSWGARWARGSSPSPNRVGLLFAAFFGLVASWPRLYTGGSYDFAMALPLLLLIVGFLPGWTDARRGTGPAAVGLGLACGVATSLSVAAGESALVLLVAYSAASRAWTREGWGRRSWQLLTVVLIEVACVARSIAALAGAPGASYAPSSVYGALNFRLIQGELNPFVLGKYKMSPFLATSFELQTLLLVGLIIAIGVLLKPAWRRASSVTTRFSELLLTGTVAAFLWTTFLLLSDLPGYPWTTLKTITNLDQASVVLFVFFEGLALLPIVTVVTLDRSPEKVAIRSETPANRATNPEPASRPVQLRRRSARSNSWVAWSLAVVIISLGAGSATTVLQGPGFIQSNVGKTSNVTAGDIAALEWAGVHLPSCSTVFVVPGSAGQFLPEYATLHLVFPMNPVPTNVSYQLAVADLTAGQYIAETHDALLALGVTEVFVTGQTSVSYPPILSAPLEASSDFSPLFAQGDAIIFSFLPGASATGCAG